MGPKDAFAAKTTDQEDAAAEGCLTGITFDAGGLIALERNDRRVLALIRMALDGDHRMVVPATALAQVIRNPAKQVRLWRLAQHDKTDVEPLDASHAQAVGLLLAKSGTSDIADAHVVICAQKTGQAVITSDPFDLKRLDPRLRLIPA
ncbi:MAG: PIN domain-containing protein [Acidobacteria bacterium]|nr:PIN domain-containing protein [Acidobacteriota bacterium]